MPSIESPQRLSGPERKRRRLLDAAAESFAQLGYAKTTVEEIARAAGVSKGLLYVHFDGKEQLLEVVLERTLRHWGETTRLEVARQSTARAALESMHTSSFAYASANPLLRRILVQDALLIRSLVAEVTRESLDEWLQDVRDLFDQGVDKGEFRSDLDLDAAVQSYALLHISFLDRLNGWEEIGSDPSLVTVAMGFLLDGMRP
ncbi:MAG: TetR/AcrR family transcriptional regulator [Acidobacteriota bacterium]